MANGELLGVSLLLEEVLSSRQEAWPLELEMTELGTDAMQNILTQVNEYPSFCTSLRVQVFTIRAIGHTGVMFYTIGLGCENIVGLIFLT